MKKGRLFLLLPTFLLTACGNSMHSEDREIIVMIVISIIIFLFIVLARYSNILRDEVNNCDEFDANAKKLQHRQKIKISNKNPFSLNKTQFGIWTIIISSSYVYLVLCKGDCAEIGINTTALVLMGIFSGTAAVSVIIDKREMKDNRPRHQNTPSQGFFIDMLWDNNGISLHRFQHFVWTLIAVTVYLYKLSQVTTGCMLPELSNTLLGLTGISSATYLVHRSKENNPAVQEVQKSVTIIDTPGFKGTDVQKGYTDTGATRVNSVNPAQRVPDFYG